MARTIVALLAVLAASLVALPAEAQWKWRDKGGHVQYSDLPPPAGTPDNDILAKPNAALRRAAAQQSVAPAASAASSGSAAVATASAPRSGDPELEAKRKKAESEAAAKAKADQEKVTAAKTENCSRARAQMTTLKSGIRIAHTNAQTGEREFIDDKQRADETRRTQEVIANDCK
ncbi:MAG TPA: DUF4124 domain-containing protein [Caldimonas sp.]|jgi:hypothetical protein|nr:DUF4124 domain-containing protein [Caldimonas sp.]